MDKQNFISACNFQLITVFEKANDILDKSHFEVFGESIASRKLEKPVLKKPLLDNK